MGLAASAGVDSRRPSIKPLPAIAPAFRMKRRVGVCFSMTGIPLRSRRMNGVADPDIGAAAADVACHRGIDVIVGGLRCVVQESSCRHNLPGLAVAALDDFLVEPRLLDLVTVGSVADRLDGRHSLCADGARGGLAGADRIAVDVNRTCATLGNTAAELRAAQPEDVAQNPQQRHVFRNIDVMAVAVHLYFEHRVFLSLKIGESVLPSLPSIRPMAGDAALSARHE